MTTKILDCVNRAMIWPPSLRAGEQPVIQITRRVSAVASPISAREFDAPGIPAGRFLGCIYSLSRSGRLPEKWLGQWVSELFEGSESR